MLSPKLLPLLAPLTLTLVSCDGNNPSTERANVILILVDDLGKEWISSYGAEEIKLPNIDRLAQEGITFHNAYSMPQSTPSRVAITTGQYPFNNGWINHYDVPRWGHGAHFDHEQNPCMPLQVKQAGYKTCAAGKWQLNDFRLQPDIMNELGFDEYCMWCGGEGGNEEISELRYWDPYIHTKEGSRTYTGEFGPDIYNDFVLDFISENRDEPFYIYYPMALTHTPFVATPHKPEAKSRYERHIAMTEYMDYLVGRVMDRLVEEGIDGRTYIIFTADNGTSGGVIGRRDGRYIGGGKTLLSENGINTPFIVKCPTKPDSHESDILIDFTDIYPTVMEIIGATQSIDERVDGVSFAKALTGEEFDSRPWVIALGSYPAMIDDEDRVVNVHPFRDRAIISQEYKIYLSLSREIERIYSIEDDPYEMENLIDNEAIFAEVSAKFEPIISSMPTHDANPKYTKLSGSIYDVPKETLTPQNKSRSNFRVERDERDFLKFKNAK